MRGKAVLKPGSDVDNVARFLRLGNKSGKESARKGTNAEERYWCPNQLEI